MSEFIYGLTSPTTQYGYKKPQTKGNEYNDM